MIEPKFRLRADSYILPVSGGTHPILALGTEIGRALNLSQPDIQSSMTARAIQTPSLKTKIKSLSTTKLL